MERPLSLLEAVPFLRAYSSGAVFVVKAGGELLERPVWRDAIARDLGVLHRLGVNVVLIHGGGPQLDAVTERMDLPIERVGGRRITSPMLIEAAVREWRGACNLAWVIALQEQGERAMGVSGVDGGLVKARRRPPVVVEDDDGSRQTVDYGQVGDIISVDGELIRGMLDLGVIPVITPLAKGSAGEVLNVNADTVAAEVAIALDADKLVLLTRAPGIQSDVDDVTSVLHWADLAALDRLDAAGALTGGMRPKVAAVRKALNGGVPKVHVVDGRRAGSLLEEVFTTEGSGTLIVNEGGPDAWAGAGVFRSQDG
jgi:acetylglutamate kinase